MGKRRPIAEKRGDGEYPWSVKYPTLERTSAGNIRYQRDSGFVDEDAALLHGWTQMAKQQAGKPDPRKASTPLGEWAATWMAAQNHSAVTATQRRRYLRNFILPAFADTPIGEINKFVVRQWAGRLTCAEVTRGQVVSLLSTILTGAEEAQMIDVNPLVRMRLRKAGAQRIQRVEEAERVWAYPETALAIAARLPRPANLMVLLAAFTGLRYGEICALHKSNCCLLRRDELDGRPWLRHVLVIDPKVGALHETSIPDEHGVERTKVFLGPPKPPNGAREVDVLEPLAAMVSAHIASWPYDYPFSTALGRWWWRSNWARVLRPACDGREAKSAVRGRRASEGWDALLPGLDLHGLRHGHKTAMEEDGVREVLQYEVMGHELAPERRPIGQRYTHVTAPMRRDRLDALAVRWEKNAALLERAA
jgi:integrase